MRRREYTKDKVKQLRVQRNLLKASDRNMQDMYALKVGKLRAAGPVSYTHLTLPTNREV